MGKEGAGRQGDYRIVAKCAWNVAKELIPLFNETFESLVEQHSKAEGETKQEIASILRKLQTFQEVRKRIPEKIFQRIVNPLRLQFPTFKPEDFEEEEEVVA